DSWAFMLENKSVAFRTAMYLTLFSAAIGGCLYMAFAVCVSLPPRLFWLLMSVICALVLPGWFWCLNVETVRVTVGRKTSIRQVHFDIFQNIALGMKFYFWIVVFCWLPFSFLMFPLAMIHMAMPVTKRGWVSFAMIPTFFRNFLPTMYYWVIS